MKLGVDCIGVTVTFFCHDGAGNFVLVKRGQNARDERGRWEVGGGAVEHGATVEDTLHREIAEEYCTDVLEYEFLGFRDVHRMNDGEPTHWIGLDFKVRVDRSKVRIGEPHKFTDIGWFTFESLPSPLHSEVPRFFEKYRGRL